VSYDENAVFSITNLACFLKRQIAQPFWKQPSKPGSSEAASYLLNICRGKAGLDGNRTVSDICECLKAVLLNGYHWQHQQTYQNFSELVPACTSWYKPEKLGKLQE